MKNFTYLIVFSLLIYSTNCKKKVGKKKESEKYQAIQNICEEDRERPVTCLCNPSDLNTAKSAVCWMYKIAGDDPLWDTFSSQPNLEKLKLKVRPDGNLPNIPTNALNHLPQLQSFEILYGHITELPPFAFSNSSSITDLSVSQNRISSLRPFAIANLPSLSVVCLDDNEILEIKRNSIRDVPSLKKLFINRNNLSIIHDFAFEHLPKVEELEVNENRISVITRETFVGLKSLVYLDLRNNKLTMIGDFTFQELENLRDLDLDRNNIEYISERAFAGLKKLSKLRLNENQLKTIGDVFSETPNIFILDLRMNGLESLTFDTLEPLWENFKNATSHIGLEKNQFRCDCHLSWVHSLRNETSNEDLKTVLKELTCVTNDQPVESSAFTLATEKPLEDQSYNDELNDEEVEYEDEIQSSEYEDEAGKPPRKKIFDIPIEQLPCPEMQKATTEMAAKSSVVYWQEASSSDPNSGFRIRFQFPTFFILIAGILLTR